MLSGIEELGPIDAKALTAWIAAIDFADWPQQSFTELKPAMVTDLAWHGFGVASDPVVAAVVAAHFPGLAHTQRMLSVVMPGHSIRLHRDLQPPSWRCRVHVPLTGNDRSIFWSNGVAHVLEPNMAYAVNTLVEHAVTNDGATARIHMMWDMSHA